MPSRFENLQVKGILLQETRSPTIFLFRIANVFFRTHICAYLKKTATLIKITPFGVFQKSRTDKKKLAGSIPQHSRVSKPNAAKCPARIKKKQIEMRLKQKNR